MSDLSRISIGVKAFLRDSKLYKTVSDIRRTMPEVQLLIADDGEMTAEKDSLYAEIQKEGHKVFILPFDSGFGKKSNKIIDNLDRDFVLVGSDDFDFAPPSVRLGIEKLLATLDRSPGLSIVSGRLSNRPYEFHLTERQPGEWYERPCSGAEYFNSVVPCDVTVNYSLIRREVFDKVRWDDEVKITGGEHGAFFIDVKQAGLKVAYVPGVEISEQPGRDSDRYRTYRFRGAYGTSRECFEKRGLKKYVLGNGQVDYERKD